ncbi:MAG: hypothetical protein IT178_04760 [Acidobacteria bacterium]|nr:hypothetical protein [Acidobacteriota bacterium]
MAQSAPDLPTLERRVEEAKASFARAEARASVSDRSSLERDLQEMQDDLAYLRVRSRRGESVSERDRQDLSGRIDRFMRRTGDLAGPAPDGRTVAVGTELDVRLQTPLNSGTTKVEDPVEATTLVHLYQGDELLVPAGSRITGYVAAVEPATRTDRKGSLSVTFTKLIVSGRTYDTRVLVTQALESEGLKGEAGRIGAGSAVGAILGGILGGLKGAVTGILVGGGGVLVATEGRNVDLPSGTVLRVRFDEAVSLDRK